ncbi:hypothetical protein EXIGLDRAFT_788610 [Exidia glandulosa HHB12029]|uniref:Uncharacterized protein n=1 Tax=Exidia glandulosa HHB12029 TaxID=1314781 RepID=A0A165IBQ9_EXIGL|nr:hypothetical protein EXIGLDRAFT_788610 [Exidia glandulosa HHB12029]
MPKASLLCDEFFTWAGPHKHTYLDLRDKGESPASQWLNGDLKAMYMAMPFSDPKHKWNLGPDGASKFPGHDVDKLWVKVAQWFRNRGAGDVRVPQSTKAKKEERAPKATELYAGSFDEDELDDLRSKVQQRLERDFDDDQARARNRVSVRCKIIQEMFNGLPDDEKAAWLKETEEKKEQARVARSGAEAVAKRQQQLFVQLGDVLTKQVNSGKSGSMVLYAFGVYKDPTTGTQHVTRAAGEFPRGQGSWFDDDDWKKTVKPLLEKFAARALADDESDANKSDSNVVLAKKGKGGQKGTSGAGAAASTNAQTGDDDFGVDHETPGPVDDLTPSPDRPRASSPTGSVEESPRPRAPVRKPTRGAKRTTEDDDDDDDDDDDSAAKRPPKKKAKRLSGLLREVELLRGGKSNGGNVRAQRSSGTSTTSTRTRGVKRATKYTR